MSRIPLTQLFLQIMILFGKTFHYSRDSLDLPFQSNGLRFVSLNVVGGRHRASEYHATLCLGSDSMANLYFPQTVPTDDAIKNHQ